MVAGSCNFAVVGNPISHSLSPVIFDKYIKGKDGYWYSRILLNDIDDLKSIITAFDIKGINVTAPFKKDILKIVDKKSEEVEAMNVANTVVFGENETVAYNTDIDGVINPLKKRNVSGENSVLVFGAGGAAMAVVVALEKMGFKDIFISNRSLEKAKIIARNHDILPIDFDEVFRKKFDVIINTIPVFVESFDRLNIQDTTVIFDANYNVKPFAEIAKRNNCTYIDGLEWLIAQGIKSYTLMTGKENGEIEFFQKDLSKIQAKSSRISLIGPMGSWKTSVGRPLAKLLGYRFYDVDNLIEEKAGMSITDIFKTKGESYFREIETEVLNEFVQIDRVVLSTGGGIIKRDENIKTLRDNTWNILLFASPVECFSRINIDKRPLLKGKNVLKVLTELFEERKDRYFQTSDLIINTENSTSLKIAEYLYEDYSKTFKV